MLGRCVRTRLNKKSRKGMGRCMTLKVIEATIGLTFIPITLLVMGEIVK